MCARVCVCLCVCVCALEEGSRGEWLEGKSMGMRNRVLCMGFKGTRVRVAASLLRGCRWKGGGRYRRFVTGTQELLSHAAQRLLLRGKVCIILYLKSSSPQSVKIGLLV